MLAVHAVASTPVHRLRDRGVGGPLGVEDQDDRERRRHRRAADDGQAGVVGRGGVLARSPPASSVPGNGPCRWSRSISAAMPAQPTGLSFHVVVSPTVRVGIHLPQFGRAASPSSITEAARLAESLGFADVWVSDHIAIPAAQDYPSPYLYDPLLTLTWAAAATERVGLGTSVLVVPAAHAARARERARQSRRALGWSPHHRCRRRLVGGGVRRTRAVVRRPRSPHGRDARRLARVLGSRSGRLPRRVRAPRRDEGPTQARASHPDLGRREQRARLPSRRGPGRRVPRHRPRPRRRGASSSSACGATDRRRRSPSRCAPDGIPQGMDPDVIRREYDEFEAAGIQHVVSAPWRNDPDELDAFDGAPGGARAPAS